MVLPVPTALSADQKVHRTQKRPTACSRRGFSYGCSTRPGWPCADRQISPLCLCLSCPLLPSSPEVGGVVGLFTLRHLRLLIWRTCPPPLEGAGCGEAPRLPCKGNTRTTLSFYCLNFPIEAKSTTCCLPPGSIVRHSHDPYENEYCISALILMCTSE